MPARILLAAIIGFSAGLICYFGLVKREQMAADFTFSWRAAWYLRNQQNPYEAIQPEGDYPFQTYYYYPLPAAVVSIPFSYLPPYLAGALFFGISSGLLAFAVSRDGWKHFPIFFGASYWVALGVVQWAPLMTAAMLLPALQWLLVCKPNLGLAGFMYRPRLAGAIGGAILLLISFILLPSWLGDWLEIIRSLEGHPPPLLILPIGPILLLALLVWRSAKARLLLGLSILPQLLFFYDQLPLILIAPDFKSGILLAALSWIGYLLWRIHGIDPVSGAILAQPVQHIMIFTYLPALVMLLWSERRRIRLPG